MTSTFKFTLLSSVAAAAVTMMAAGTASATNGMQPSCIGTDRCGMGGAGMSIGTSPTDTAINPALGARLGNTYQINLGMFKAKVTGNSAYDGGTARQKSTDDAFPNGSFAVNYVIDDTKTFNIFVGPLAGGAVKWQRSRTTNFGGVTPQDTVMNYMDAQIQPSMAFKTDNGSYGIGAILSRGTIKTNAMIAVGNYAPNSQETFYGAGFHLGGVWDIGDGMDFGLAYRSPILHQHTGVYNNTVFLSPIDTPQQLSAGLSWAPADKWTVATDVKWVNYAETETIGTKPAGGGFGWMNQIVFMIGTEYAMSDTTTLRLGYNHGDSPIGDNETFYNFLYPAVVEDHFTVGSSHNIGGAMEVGFSGYITPKANQTDAGTGPFGGGSAGTTLSHQQYGFQLSFKNDF